MGFDIGAAATVLSPILGMAMSNQNQEEQYRQQEKLQNLQNKGYRENTDYSYAKQFEMWEKTNYAAQVAQMQKAGLSPGLIYGMKGGGGTTTGSGGGPMPSSTGANPTARSEGARMAMDIATQVANLDLIKAQTTKTKAEAAKTAGVDTELATGQIEKLAQETDNARIQNNLMRLDEATKHITNFELQTTQADRMKAINIATQKAQQELEIINNTSDISDATKQTAIQEAKTRLAGAALQNALTKEQISNTQQDTRVKKETVDSIYNRIQTDWERLGVEKREQSLREILAAYNMDLSKDIVKGLVGQLGSILSLGKKGTTIYNDHYHVTP